MAKDFEENVIEWLSNDGRNRATLSLSQRKYITLIKRLAKTHPDECQIVAENTDGSICAHIPATWVRVAPPTKRQFTEEQKAASRERIKAVNAKRRKSDTQI